jgi:large subunit ribosomal protein L10Ae
MSKISRDVLVEAIKDILQTSKDKKKGFLETIDLQISLKNYDPNKDKRFSGAFRLPHVPRPKFSVCILGDAKHVGEAKALNIVAIHEDELKKIGKEGKDKKAIKKLCQKYDAFLASASLVRKIPRLAGPGFNRAGKFPAPLGANENIKNKVEDTKATVKFQLKNKKALCMGVAIANVEQTEAEILANITSAVNYLVSLLPKNWQQIKRLYIKSSMGTPHRIFGF